MECLERTVRALRERKLSSIVSSETVSLDLHRRRTQAATFMAQAWARFQAKVSLGASAVGFTLHLRERQSSAQGIPHCLVGKQMLDPAEFYLPITCSR